MQEHSGHARSRSLYLFDIDGTLLRAHGSGRVAFDLVFAAQHGIEDASKGVRFGGKTDPQIVTDLYRTHLNREPTAAELDAFYAAYLPILHRLLAEHGAEVIDGVLDALEVLSRADVLLGIATGNIREGAIEKLAAAKLSPWFTRDGTVEVGSIGGYGCDSAVRANVVARAIERGRAHGATGEVIVVGDTIHDISAARACEATVCAVATGADPAPALAAADVVFSSLAELPAWHVQRFGSSDRTRR